MQHFPKELLLEITISNFGSVHQKTPANYVFTSPITQSYCSLFLKVNSKHKFKRKNTRERENKFLESTWHKAQSALSLWAPSGEECPFTLESHELAQLITLHHLLNAFSTECILQSLSYMQRDWSKKIKGILEYQNFLAPCSVTLEKRFR